jgi:FMN reductase
MRRPLVLGIGGTIRSGSSSEKALALALASAEIAGAEIMMLSGADLDMPMYDPKSTARADKASRFVELVRQCDGLILSSPCYHGALPGLIKNAIDYIEDLRDDRRPYLEGRAVGCIVCAAGWQGTGSTLSGLRDIVHALRGWPTPLAATINSLEAPFENAESGSASKVKSQLDTVARQVVHFANQIADAQGSAALRSFPLAAKQTSERSLARRTA